ncbi:LacI family DNA-binding transcriptional regulator [Chitinivibrio alkaliphilus]|uniref:Transcriptional regulator, LacI family n=1 Tax=Chitinivibrio alkaliphilus ACht1 TaxID=1313304 RepID=U7D9X3_9BACT|nr:substrate-binding domain-containing protein [Chitinivibrio alkaliphilus]ERP38787.1 transcriptional regulator, LacI family [Chitinivibrio alkaliphilus ACht1]
MKKSIERLNFGVLLSTIEEPGQHRVWKGIERFCRQNNIDVTAYISVFQQKTGKLEEHYKVIFDAIRTNTKLDGLIYLGGFIAEDIGNATLMEFIDSIPCIPRVSIASSCPGETAFLTDNEAGTYHLVRHLITDCKKQKIAFLCGPDDHEEAQARFAGYMRALQEFRIPFSEKLVIRNCQFSVEEGEEAVEQLLKRGADFDAIAAVDDDTALGALQALDRHTISVPDDVLLGGFDNSDISQNSTPSLTTLNQPFDELGYRAAEALQKLCTHPETEHKINYISAELLTRESTENINCIQSKIPLPAPIQPSIQTVCVDPLSAHFIENGYIDLPISPWIQSLTSALSTPPLTRSSSYK